MTPTTRVTAGNATRPGPDTPPRPGLGAPPPLPELDPVTLREPVRQALGARRAEVTGWTAEPVYGGLDKTSSVYRVRGAARVGGETRAWSLILKVFCPAPGREDPAGAFYWRREALAYTSDVLDGLPGGLRAARCFGAEERPGAVWLWLEHVEGVPGQEWSAEQMVEAARRLGAFVGVYAAGRPLPSLPWLPHAWHRAWAAASAPYIPRLRAEPDHPLVRAGWPDDLYPAALRFWEEDLPRFLEARDRLPQALQHGDPSNRNLFRCADPTGATGETVAIDWAWLNVSAIGDDLATLVNQVAFRAPEAEREAYVGEVLAAYAAGMRDAGWRGDTAHVRLGYLLATAEHYLAHPLMLALLDEAEQALAERSRGMPVEQFMRRVSRVVRRGQEASVEARALLAQGALR